MRVRLLLCYGWIVHFLQRSASPGRYLTINSIAAIQTRALLKPNCYIYKYVT